MTGAIELEEAESYLKNVHKHQLKLDVEFLHKFSGFPVATTTLDVGFGSGYLLLHLAKDPRSKRKLFGIEKSKQLYDSNRNVLNSVGVTAYNGDYLNWQNDERYMLNYIVMSFYLHHQKDPQEHILHSSNLLTKGNKLIIYDRVADTNDDKKKFFKYWSEYYQNEHEWNEECPNILTEQELFSIAEKSGLRFVRSAVAKHDTRAGASGFRKKAYEFWKIDSDSDQT